MTLRDLIFALGGAAVGAVWIGLLAAYTAAASGRGLTLVQARELVAASGFNPGTVRQLGDAGRYALRAVSVTGGGQDFTIRVRVERLD